MRRSFCCLPVTWSNYRRTHKLALRMELLPALLRWKMVDWPLRTCRSRVLDPMIKRISQLAGSRYMVQHEY
jgi:hypothetical protein